jgi:integrase
MPRRRSFGWIRKLPSGRYQASYVAPDGLRRSAASTFATKTDAGLWLTRVEVSIQDGRWRDPVLARQRFAEYAQTWIAERPGLRPRTVDNYCWLYKRHLAPHLGRMTLEDITPAAVRRWRSLLLENGASLSATAKAYRLLRAILNTAVDDDVIDRNPCRIRGAGDEKPAERPTLTIEQVQQLCGAVPARFSAFIAVKTYGSLRWGEIIALHRRDLDMQAGVVTIRAAYVQRTSGAVEIGTPKSRAGSRRVALPEPVVQMLAAHLDAYVPDDPDALVFASVRGRPLRRSSFNRTVNWAQARAIVGVPNLHLHDYADLRVMPTSAVDRLVCLAS